MDLWDDNWSFTDGRVHPLISGDPLNDLDMHPK